MRRALKLSNGDKAFVFFDMKTEDGRLAWARDLFSRLDGAKPAESPLQPYELRGESPENIAELRQRESVTEREKDVLRSWHTWQRACADTRGQNRLKLWSLLRMVQIFSEKPDTVGQADIVRKFLGNYWNLRGDELDTALRGHLHKAVERLT